MFDGHGGHACAQAVSERLPYYIAVSMMSESVLEDLEAAMETLRPVPPILQWYKHHNDYNYRESAALYINHLRVYWQELLASEEHGDGMRPADALSYAFQRLDTDLSLEAQVPLANDLMQNTAIQAAFAGCTACVALRWTNRCACCKCRRLSGSFGRPGAWWELECFATHKRPQRCQCSRGGAAMRSTRLVNDKP